MTKVISISDEAYGSLKRVKGKDSFSGTILRLTKPFQKKTLLDVVNSFAPNEELAGAVEKVYKGRSKFKFKKVVL